MLTNANLARAALQLCGIDSLVNDDSTIPKINVWFMKFYQNVYICIVVEYPMQTSMPVIESKSVEEESSTFYSKSSWNF